jgi:tetratricopeptide (TPR) repeat protein
MRFKKLVIILTAFLLLSIVATACNAPLKYGTTTPFDNPETIIKNYFDLLAKKDYVGAYSMISIETKKGFTQDQFLQLQDLYAQSSYVFQRATTTLVASALPAVDSVRYFTAFEFTCKLTYNNGLNDTQASEEMSYYIVAEDGVWKVHLPNAKITFQNFMVYAYTRLGIMYSSGSKVAVDKAKALDYFQKVLVYSPKDSIINTFAAQACLDLGQYAQGLKYINTAVKNATKDEDKINIYCIKGALLAKSDKTAEAITWFDKAQVLEDALPPDSTKPKVVANYRAKYLP